MVRAAFTTLGCKVNQYETQRILESFENAGFAVVPFDAEADLYVVNTCSVTSQAEAKSRYTVRRATRANPQGKVVVTGCATQTALNRGEAFDGADLLVPNPDKLETLASVRQAFPGLADAAAAEPAPVPDRSARGRTRATLKVQDGCDVLCSYCSIPFTRPGLRSRPWREVLAEAQAFAALGYREIVLTGVLIGAYGPATGSEGPDFETLVETLAAESGVPRIRVSSIEMHQVTDRLAAMAADGRLAPHFHVPLQSGDSGVLADMNRRYDQAQYLALCTRLTRDVPDLSLTTDVMVGFPTETAERFESSVHVCWEAKFLKAHVFRFSPRWGTPADQWGDPVPPGEKQDRARTLAAVSAETGRQHARRFLGRTLRVLVETKVGADGLLEGLTDNYLTVRFAGPRSMARTFQWVRLDEEKDGVLFGEPVLTPPSTQLHLSTAR